MMQPWDKFTYRRAERPLGQTPLHELIQNRRAIVLAPNLLDDKLLSAARRSILENRDRAVATRYVNGSLTTIGPYLVKHLNQMDRYYNEAHATDVLFPVPELDLRSHVREKLKWLFGMERINVAAERDGRLYAPSVVRIHSDGVMNPLHNDNIMRDATGMDLVVARLKHQLSCIVCIQECDIGGALRHYRKVWSPQDEEFKIRDGLGYRSEVVAGVPACIFKPNTGDVYLINPTNYHEIDRVEGQDRITLGFFLGFYDDDLRHGVVWS